MEYHGKLYGKAGKMYFPLSETSEDFDNLKKERDELRIRVKNQEITISNYLDRIDHYERILNKNQKKCNMNWTDGTVYSRGSDRTQTAWELKTPSLRIWIGNTHRDYPDKWVMHCFAIGISAKVIGPIKDMTVEQAQELAIELVRANLNKMHMDLNNATK